MLRGLKLKKPSSGDETPPEQSRGNQTLQRESWMLKPPDDGGAFSARSRSSDTDGKEGKEPRSSVRELNPYWKDGGDGLPTGPPSSRKTPSVVGDGGASWRARAMRRTLERADQEERGVREEVERRFTEELRRRKEEMRAMRSAGETEPSTGTETRRSHYHNISGAASGGRDGRARDWGREGRREERWSGAESSGRWGRKMESRGIGGGMGREPLASMKEHRSGSIGAARHEMGHRRVSREMGRLQQEAGRAVPPPPRPSPAATAATKATTDGGPEDIEERMNKLAAMAMKAELMGNMERHKELSEELEKLRAQSRMPASRRRSANASVAEESSSSSARDTQKEVVVLPEFDLRGKRVAPSRSGQLSSSDDMSVQDMLREEKAMDTQYSDLRSFHREMTRDRRFGKDRSIDQEYDDMFDSGGMESFTSGGPSGKKRKRDQDRLNLEQREQRARRMQIREHLRQETIFQKCHFCYGASRGSKVFKKHLVISLGDKCLLMLPPFGSLVDQHCIIAPLDHKLSMAHLDEDEQHEVERFKQSLRNMFMAQNMDVLFMETVTPYNLRRQRHAYLECIPVPIHAGQEAPSFFKVAIMESDEEWSQHKKVIDTQGRSIQKCVPKDFPYFHVDFGHKRTGFVHVIENEAKFSFNFGKEIVAGMLQLPPNAIKNASREAYFEKERQLVLKFLERWKAHDWTVELEGGSY